MLDINDRVHHRLSPLVEGTIANVEISYEQLAFPSIGSNSMMSEYTGRTIRTYRVLWDNGAEEDITGEHQLVPIAPGSRTMKMDGFNVGDLVTLNVLHPVDDHYHRIVPGHVYMILELILDQGSLRPPKLYAVLSDEPKYVAEVGYLIHYVPKPGSILKLPKEKSPIWDSNVREA
jgi:hypothetical protein